MILRILLRGFYILYKPMTFLEKIISSYSNYNNVHDIVAKKGFFIPDEIADLLKLNELGWKQDDCCFSGYDNHKHIKPVSQIDICQGKDDYIPQTQIRISGTYIDVGIDFYFKGCGTCYPEFSELKMSFRGQPGITIHQPNIFETVTSEVSEGKIIIARYCTTTDIAYRDGISSFQVKLPKSPVYARR